MRIYCYLCMVLNMKKVFHIVTHFDVGGAERVAVNIAKSRTEGYEYHVVELVRAHSQFTKVFTNELREAGIRYHRAHVPDVHFRYVFQRIAAIVFPLWFLPLMLKHRPAAVHCHTEMPDLAVWWFFTLFPRLLRRCKVVRTIHNTVLWTGLKNTGRRVERFFIRNGCNVAISQSVRDSYAKEYGQTPPIIYNGVEETPQRKCELGGATSVNILFAGRLEPQKGISTLIEIVKRLKDDGRFHFYIVGDGRLRPVVEREIGALPCVTLHAPIHGLAACLSSFDYMLMPSEFEGLGLMSVEASLAGVPVIANMCPGLCETLPPDWPLAVHGNSIDEYMDIFKTLEKRANGSVLVENAQTFARRMFSVRRMQEEYEKIY